MRYRSTDPPVLFVREPETVGAYDAKTRLPELLADVEAGRVSDDDVAPFAGW
jgi:hypothetical protein